MRKEGSFLWQCPVIVLDKKPEAFELCFNHIETAKKGKKYLNPFPLPGLVVLRVRKWQVFWATERLFTYKLLKSLSEKPDAYTPKEYENSLSYRLEVKGRVECLSYEAFRNMEMQGRGEEILDGTEGRS